MIDTQVTSTPQKRPAIGAMGVGLGLTVVATVVPYLTDALADHVKAGYPNYTQGRVDTAVTTWLVVLTVIGALGVLCWLGAIRLVKSDARWASSAVTALFVLGATVAVTGLLIKDTSGDTGLPSMLGWLGVLPCLPGLVAVALVRRRS